MDQSTEDTIKVNPELTHTCRNCGHRWQSVDYVTERGKVVKAEKVARDIRTAAKVNKEEPVCSLCHHLIMAQRHAAAMKHFDIAKELEDWIVILSKKVRK